MALTKEQRVAMIEEDRKIRNRAYALMRHAAETLSREFDIGYYDAEHELVKWGREKDEGDW